MCNPTPATEYAVYWLAQDRYSLDPYGHLALFATRSMAVEVAESTAKWTADGRYEIRKRLNFTIGPFEPVDPVMQVVSVGDLLAAVGAPSRTEA